MPHSQPTALKLQQTVCKFHLDPQYHISHWGSTILGDSTLCGEARLVLGRLQVNRWPILSSLYTRLSFEGLATYIPTFNYTFWSERTIIISRGTNDNELQICKSSLYPIFYIYCKRYLWYCSIYQASKYSSAKTNKVKKAKVHHTSHRYNVRNVYDFKNLQVQFSSTGTINHMYMAKAMVTL